MKCPEIQLLDIDMGYSGHLLKKILVPFNCTKMHRTSHVNFLSAMRPLLTKIRWTWIQLETRFMTCPEVQFF